MFCFPNIVHQSIGDINHLKVGPQSIPSKYGQAAESKVCWAHHHGCHGSHQTWALPVVPLDAIVTNHIGGCRVVYAVQVGWPTSLEPPAWNGQWTKNEVKGKKDRIN